MSFYYVGISFPDMECRFPTSEFRCPTLGFQFPVGLCRVPVWEDEFPGRERHISDSESCVAVGFAVGTSRFARTPGRDAFINGSDLDIEILAGSGVVSGAWGGSCIGSGRKPRDNMPISRTDPFMGVCRRTVRLVSIIRHPFLPSFLQRHSKKSSEAFSTRSIPSLC